MILIQILFNYHRENWALRNTDICSLQNCLEEEYYFWVWDLCAVEAQEEESAVTAHQSLYREIQMIN